MTVRCRRIGSPSCRSNKREAVAYDPRSVIQARLHICVGELRILFKHVLHGIPGIQIETQFPPIISEAASPVSTWMLELP